MKAIFQNQEGWNCITERALYWNRNSAILNWGEYKRSGRGLLSKNKPPRRSKAMVITVLSCIFAASLGGLWAQKYCSLFIVSPREQKLKIRASLFSQCHSHVQIILLAEGITLAAELTAAVSCEDVWWPLALLSDSQWDILRKTFSALSSKSPRKRLNLYLLYTTALQNRASTVSEEEYFNLYKAVWIKFLQNDLIS